MTKPRSADNTNRLLTNPLTRSIMAKPNLTAERLRELLHYDRETGIFTWLSNPGKNALVGRRAGSVARGYVILQVDKNHIPAHRAAWFFVYGYWPEHFIDHINGDPADNRISNLREATKRENMQNLKASFRNNKCGILGVSKRNNRFRAVININGSVKHIGYFDTPEDAHSAYLEEKRASHPYCTI